MPQAASAPGDQPTSTLFISDLHLDPSRPAVTRVFLDFLAGPARKAAALYILGDLFEAWIGDDAIERHHGEIATGLKALSTRIPIYFMAGNRDFLLGAEYARLAGMERIAEPVLHDFYGVSTLLLHGDILCTDDTEYRAFRAMVHNPAWQHDFLAKPIEVRRAMAGTARERSGERLRTLAPEIMDVNPEAVAQTFRKQGVRRVIHGHTHRPAIHQLEVDGIARERIVLGNWHEQGGSVLWLDANGPRLEAPPLQAGA